MSNVLNKPLTSHTHLASLPNTIIKAIKCKAEKEDVFHCGKSPEDILLLAVVDHIVTSLDEAKAAFLDLQKAFDYLFAKN